jgi:hypothetical protein
MYGSVAVVVVATTSSKPRGVSIVCLVQFFFFFSFSVYVTNSFFVPPRVQKVGIRVSL